MSSITTINSSDVIGNSRADINTNFSNLNTDKVEGQAASIDSEVALFSGTGGKTIKRASTTGIATLTAGVLSVTSTTGTGNVVLASSPTITTPTIGSYINANHSHQNSGGGGVLDAAAVSSGTVATARLGSGTANSTTFLRGDQTWATPASGGSTLFAGAGEAVTDGTLGLAGTSAFLPVIQFADAATKYAAWAFLVPTGATSISSIKIYYEGAAAGNLYLAFRTARVDTDTAGTAVSQDLTDSNTAYAGQTSGTGIITAPSGSYNGLASFDAGDIVSVYVSRVAGDALDTYNTQWDVVGCEIVFA